MHADDDALAWSILARAPRLDRGILAAALAVLGEPRALIGAAPAAYHRAGLPPAASAFLSSAPPPGRAERQWLAAPEHHLLPFCDARFPPLLREWPKCPLALYVAGSARALAAPQLAIVGSRNPTPAGRQTAFSFAEHLSQNGLAITSGLAEGIDAHAHRGAIEARGITVAVLGSGIDLIYPRSNSALYAEVREHGALVSEFPLGTPPRRGNFPRRNRLIAAMSLGTLVIEAAPRSGSLITAHWAARFGRGVFAVPGSIHNPLSRGCHALIRAGAHLTESADEVLKGLSFSTYFPNAPRAAPVRDSVNTAGAGMDKDRKILLDALGFDPVDLDTLVVRTGLKAAAVSSTMLILELEGYVQAAIGGRYSRVADRSRS